MIGVSNHHMFTWSHSHMVNRLDLTLIIIIIPVEFSLKKMPFSMKIAATFCKNYDNSSDIVNFL